MNYTNREVVHRLKQYDMFLDSLNLTNDETKKERIYDQLDKIEKQILLETNSEYEEEYTSLLGEETEFFSDEKTRLRKIINLIMDRKIYLEDRKAKHKKITGSLVELTTFLGEDKLSIFKKRLNIIEKYEENKLRQENLVKEMKVLDVKISEASRNVKANMRLNDILENKMMGLVGKSLDKLNLYSLTSQKEDIVRKYESSEYAMNLAKENLKSAKEINDSNMVLECDNMLSEVALEYSMYNEKMNILKLIDIYDKTVSNYNELLEKRKNIDLILKEIPESQLYKEIGDELNKQFNSIKLEKQDIETYNALKNDREIKNKTLYELEEENNSKEFKEVLYELIKNENRVREEKIKLAKQEEYQERQKKLFEEQKIEASRVRRQKLIEEAKLKEQLLNTEKLMKLQENTVINKKEELDEKVKNPLEGKSFDDVVSSNDFNMSELFGNTKIVPNKTNEEEIIKEKSILEEVTNEKEEKTTDKDLFKEEEDKPTKIEAQKPSQNIDALEEEKEKIIPNDNLVIDNNKEKEVVSKKKNSIYDLVEDSNNIIWKTTDSNINRGKIPVIENNKLKPEMLDDTSDISFPGLDGEDGDMLWKETL